MAVMIDPEFRSLCPPLSEEEYQQLQANLLADGCRDPLVVWEEEGLLLDGHNREKICRAHALDYAVHPLSLSSREEAVNWIIGNQLGRRNLTPEQKSYLRGKRFNQQKQQGSRTDLTSSNNWTKSTSAAQLAKEYHVARPTIIADGQFATAVDTLDAQVRADIRETVLKRQERGKQQATKKQVTRVGHLVQAEQVKPMPFMQRPGWKPYHVLQAIEILGTLPSEDHPILNQFLDRPFLPADEGMQILKNVQHHTRQQRTYLYGLIQSPDPREQTLALTLAADKVAEPDPQVLLAHHLKHDVQAIRDRQRRNWRQVPDYADEPWIQDLDAIDALLVQVQTRWDTIAQHARTRHQEKVAEHAKAYDTTQ
jgi:hypothetical protein